MSVTRLLALGVIFSIGYLVLTCPISVLSPQLAMAFVPISVVLGFVSAYRGLRAERRNFPDYRYPPGHCQGCGYDLTGNESGRCSECGMARKRWPWESD